jgi:3-hydroxy-9,10-secoandrosta-1,3,5(10)-triene-9,17-dione monooxygenase reductase component
VPDPYEAPAERLFDSARYRQVLGHFPTGVTIVTATDPEGEPCGLAVGSFTSVSLEPPLVAFLPAKGSKSWPRIERAGRFCVNILAEDQEHIGRIFATSGTDKFRGLGWRRSSNGAPLIQDVLAWIDCDIESVYETGDHFIVVGHVTELGVERDKAGPLVFFRGGYGVFDS